MTKRLIIFSVLFFLLLVSTGFGQPKKIIIDTDCGFDDLSSISLFLSMPDVEVLAITSCGGNIDAETGYYKICSLIETLNDSAEFNFNYSKIFTGIDSKSGEKPSWREDEEKIIWGFGDYQPEIIKSNETFEEIIENSGGEIYYICLGPFSNLKKVVKQNKNLIRKIKKVYWYNGSVNTYGFNYEYDKEAADYIFSQDLVVNIISNLGDKQAFYDDNTKDKIVQTENIFTQLISTNINNELTHYRKIWDELVAVYFYYPEIFEMLPEKNNPKISINTSVNMEFAKRGMLKIWSGIEEKENNIVFDIFPSIVGDFKFDIAEIADTVISLYGKDEWKACVLTNEFHRHLGIYSIIGAKMGIFAMEYLKCEKDNLLVTSFAGKQPPVSCLNDGLQMSTGATLGYGTISISDSSEILPEADFQFGETKIHIKLKPEYVDKINNDILNGILTYGNLTEGYWILIRKLGIKYWLEWDRDEIFEVSEK